MSTSLKTSEPARGNYPPPGDTTSEGGSTTDVRVDSTQTFAPVSERGLIDQTTDGQPLGNEIEDAWQGSDMEATKRFQEEQDKRPGNGLAKTLNPYGESLETRGEAEGFLKTAATDTRARTYQAEIPEDKR